MIMTSLQTAPPAGIVPAFEPPVIRAANAADSQWIDELHGIAFGPGRFSRTAFRIRERFPIDPTLSLVAECEGVPCGSVWMTPISVSGVNGYLLGPLATHPNFRKRGAGKALARAAMQLAMARREGDFVLLVGDQDYYCPLGFAVTTRGAIQFPGPVDPDRVLVHASDPTLAARLAGPIAAVKR